MESTFKIDSAKTAVRSLKPAINEQSNGVPTVTNALRSKDSGVGGRSVANRLVEAVQTEQAAVGNSEMLHQLYLPIVGELERVERRFRSELNSNDAGLDSVLKHGTQLGGKRLRPAMLLLAGAAVGPLSEAHVILGTVIEMVHTATLIHDDVLDSADSRRHVATINAKWNEHTSILVGDYLFAQSFRLAATLPSTEACQLVGEAARVVCEGELRQILHRDILELDEATYIDMLRGKTGKLCSISCRLGAQFAGGDESTRNALATFGDSVGIAFQIADDFLDIWGNDRTVGKTLGTDIAQGKLTLPIIRLLQTAPESQRRGILDILRGEEDRRLNAILPLLNRSDAARYTMATAEAFQRQALAALDVLAPSDARTALRAIADFSIRRKF